MNDLISIIVPVFNAEKFLKSCLDSMILQDYENWEAILIDDGSVDRSFEICEEYAEKDSRFHLIHQENKGVSGARNRGIKEAKGKFITFVDADDTVMDNYLSHLYSLITKENVCLACCSFAKEKERDTLKLVSKRKNAFKSLFDVKSGIQGYIGGKIIRADIIKENNLLFDEEKKLCEDLLFLYEYFCLCDENCKAYVSGKGLYIYNPHESSALGSITYNKERILDWIKLLEVYDIISSETEDKSLKHVIKLNKVMQTINFCRIMIKCGYEDKAYIKKQLRFIRMNIIPYMLSNYFPLKKRIWALLVAIFPNRM